MTSYFRPVLFQDFLIEIIDFTLENHLHPSTLEPKIKTTNS